VTENIEQVLSDELIHLNAYAPTRLVRNDVKNSSRFKYRFLPFCFAIGLHGIFFWWLDNEWKLAEKFLPDEVVTVLEFFTPEQKPKPIEVLPDMPVRLPHAVGMPSAAAQSQVRNATGVAVQAQSPDKTNTNSSLTLYDDDGRIRLPVDFIEKLDEENSPHKRFDFMNPDLELAGTFLKRPPAIEFNPTQFDQAWKPNKDILNEFLDKAVEKTTKEIRIPVPGNPTVKLVCKVSVLALGGGCGFVPNGGLDRVIPDDEDDPNTLSPEEDKECQAWWEKINGTHSQREWMKTKELYELSCKKPLAKPKIKAR